MIRGARSLLTVPLPVIVSALMRLIPSLAQTLIAAGLWSGISLGTEAPDEGDAPRVIAVTPAPGFVQELVWITVTFSEPVTGVQPGDFLLNGFPATGVSGTGSSYTFHFDQPPYGPVDVAWGTLHTIEDLGQPAERFDAGGPGATWAYQLVDPDGPSLASVMPMPLSHLRYLGQVEVSFTRPVSGVDAADLLLNGVPASAVSGVGAGPYRFSFPPAQAGPARLEWSADHGIASDEEVVIPFTGLPWSYAVDPGQAAPAVVINEIVAENQTGLVDEDQDPEDWIELWNRGTEPVNLSGWSLSVDREEEGQWVFPQTILAPGGHLLVWASGKDRREPVGGKRLHANFKLNVNGDTLRLFGPELPRTLLDELVYPEQSPDHAYSRLPINGGTVWQYHANPTPALHNSPSTITGKVSEVHFSVERGFFDTPFTLTLASRTPGAHIRYTLNGSPPSLTNGLTYSAPISISTNRVVRAAAFAPDQLPSRIRTHTYLMGLRPNRRLLPVLSLVTATNNLYGRSGIMEYNPRNTTKHGPAWERPVSVEWIRPEDNGGFQVDAGLRVAGGDYIRARYNYRNTSPPEGKYSFRLYFRGEYGAGRLEYPIFPESTLESYNTLHVRAGMNDHTNPFIKDEFVRRLTLDLGLTACHGTFVYLFLNGVYKGMYNPCERVDDDFLQAYHGGGDLWDVMGPNNQAIRGDSTAWNQLRTAVRKDLNVPSNYLDVAARMDLTNFVDYLLPLLWADNDDWPHNNTRAAREKVPGARFRFYPWDAEFAFSSHPVTYDTIARTLSSMSPPWGTTDYQAMFNSLKKTTEFRLLFADRVHRAFYNNGPLTDANLRLRYNDLKGRVSGSITSFNDIIGTWITGRHRHLTNSLVRAGLIASSNAPVASHWGGPVAAGHPLELRNLTGAIWFTTDGTDPRTPLTGEPAAGAKRYSTPLRIDAPQHVVARSFAGTNWSARIDLIFQIADPGNPLRITEIMFNPPGGDIYEYVELQNTGRLAVRLDGCSFDGIQFRFPAPFPELAPGERLVIANDARPGDFQARYPALTVAGWFGGSLANGGERLTLLDSSGRTLAAVEFSDEPPWPEAADGGGSSLEILDPLGDGHNPANWEASAPGGSPGAANTRPADPVVRINEIHAGSDRDWLELFNAGDTPLALHGWSLSDNSDPRRFVFPSGTVVAGGEYLQVECGGSGAGGALRAPFQLDRTGETIALFDARTNRVASVQYGAALDAHTTGLVGGQWVLCEPTPGAANTPTVTGSLSDLKINEFLANPEASDDWVELHHPGRLPVALQGCAIATSNALARITAPTFIAPGGFVALWADDDPGPAHLSLKLPAGGGLIRLLSSAGAELDRVTYGPQATGTTLGRLPDGSGAWQQLEFSSTRGTSNYLAELGGRLRMTELLARSTSGPDWVELENVSGTLLTLEGCAISLEEPNVPVASWPLSGRASLPPGARMLAYFGSVPAGFVPAAGSAIIPTSLRDGGAILTVRDSLARIMDRVEYGWQIPDRSVGRLAEGWVLQAGATPGAVNGPAAALDSGNQVRLNEWLAGGGDTGDFVELFNPALLPVDLSGWVLTDDPSLSGVKRNRIVQFSFLDGGGFACFQAGIGPDGLGFGLDLLGETLRLLNPSGRIIDSMDYGVQADGVSQGRYPDGAADIVAFPGSLTPGAPNQVLQPDADGDGLDDVWELAHGLNPNGTHDAQEDSDGDGMSNLREFLSGTDPRDSASVFSILVSGTKGGGLPAIRFVAEQGRVYRVEFTDRVSPAAWAVLSELPAGERREVMVNDRTPSLERPTRFYRVVIRSEL